jgi:hypothetical protein
MITCEEIYGLHTSKTPESAIHAAYRDIPLDSRNGMRKNATPLHMACTFADEEAVRILLERGADVNVKNDDGDTPLCVLAKHNYCRQEAAGVPADPRPGAAAAEGRRQRGPGGRPGL